jgi:hypothetical protein
MRARIIAAAAGVTLLVAGCGGAETAAGGDTDGSEDLPEDLQAVHEATADFVDPATAEAAGYQLAEECVAHPEGQGAMGWHSVNPELAQDTELSETEPEVLVYVPDGDGGRELGALEWFIADADQDLATDGDRPSLFGQEFDGPMEPHEEGQPVHYDLHAWMYTDNPDGLFAPWNPDVSCPE